MRRLVLLLASVLTGCSVLFDPGRVPVPTPHDCSKFIDTAYLEGVVGEAPGRITWKWPSLTDGYRLCTTVPGGMPSCLRIGCVAPECSFAQDGLSPGVRVTATVGVETCEGVPRFASGAATPIDTTSSSGWTVEQRNCQTAELTAVAGNLSVDQQGFGCATAFTPEGDWDELTLDADVRISSVASGVSAGFVLEQKVNSHRLRLIAAVDAPTRLIPAELSRRTSTTDDVQAQGLHTLSTDWQHVRIVVRGNVVSWQQGPVGGALVEVLRWTDRTPESGRIGLTADGTGRFEVRNLRVSSIAAELPEAPTSVRFAFGIDGGLAGSRAVGVPVVNEACPALADCDGGCAPPSGATCGRFSRTGLFIDYSQLALPAPRGLDAQKDVEVSLRFGLPADAGTTNTYVISLPTTRLLDTSPTETQVAQVSVPTLLAAGTWHRATFVFPADGGVVSGTVDGVPVTSTSRWPSGPQSRSFDALRLGNALNASDFWLHEVTVEQK